MRLDEFYETNPKWSARLQNDICVLYPKWHNITNASRSKTKNVCILFRLYGNYLDGSGILCRGTNPWKGRGMGTLQFCQLISETKLDWEYRSVGCWAEGKCPLNLPMATICNNVLICEYFIYNLGRKEKYLSIRSKNDI